MNKYTLSILIPSRNEMFLARTVQDILENKRGATQVIVGLDGQWADPVVPDHPDVVLVYYPESIGQRAMTNRLCEISQAKYVLKCDAHCSFDEGFDVKMFEMFEQTGDNVTAVPIMRNLHAFNWVCPDGHSRYQGPSGPCTECGKETTRDVVWIGKQSPQSKSYCFDSEPHFQYFGEFCKRPEGKGDLTETMSLQGSCFMMTREKYWELDICSESFPSWGSQGIEVACKTWLSGGRVVVNWKTWYAHMFRTQGGDFGFPYSQSGRNVSKAKAYAKELFFENKWPKQVRPLSWLLDKFWPIKGWTEEERLSVKKFDHVINAPKVAPVTEKGLTKGIIFYTDNMAPLHIAHKVQRQLRSISNKYNIPIVSTSLKPMPKMGKNIHMPLERGYLTMFKQILTALEESTADIIFFCEHDVLYHPSHFDFNPEDKNTFYYNVNVWKVRVEDGHSLYVNNCRQVSGICVFREAAITHYKERVAKVEKEGYSRNMGFEPESHGRVFWENRFTKGTWNSSFPNLDLRHSNNLTPNRWDPSLFRDKRNCEGWTEKNVSEIEGWKGLVL